MGKLTVYAQLALAFVKRIVGNKDKMKIVIAAFVLLLLLALATTCAKAAEPTATAQVEVGSTIIRGETPVLGLNFRWADKIADDADIEFGLMLIGNSDEGRNPNQALLQAQVVDGWGPIEIGLGAGFLMNVDRFNGSRANFSLRLGYKITDRLTVVVRHFSNAGTRMPNLGRDMVTLSWSL